MKKIILSIGCLLMLCTGLNAQSTGEILTIPANPDKEFYWGYALYLPKTMDTSKKLPLLLIMTDSGVTDSAEETEKKTLFRLRYELSEYPVADELGVPLVMPIVPRPEELYTHALSRAVLVSKQEPYKRLDLQVLKMLEDARQQLKKRHIKTKKKFLVTGFSAAGVFAWRWTMLYPEYVLAVATGGALYPMLPVEEWNGESLIYPVGVGDLKEIAGKKFNQKAWSKIPIFVTNGERDDNDTLPYEECFNPLMEGRVLRLVLPGKDIFQRREKSLQLLAQMAPNVQTHLYPWLGHKPVTEDVIAFLKKHIHGGPLNPIQPTDTSDQKPDFPVQIVEVLWGDNSQIPAEHRKWMPANALVLKTSATYPNWVYSQYGKIDVLCNGEIAANPSSIGSLSDGKKSFLFFNLNLTPAQISQLRKKCQKFHLRARYPKFLDISENITFTIK